VTVPGREFEIVSVTGILLACQQYSSNFTFMICIKAIGGNPISDRKRKNGPASRRATRHGLEAVEFRGSQSYG
jgi:hypothetical protein